MMRRNRIRLLTGTAGAAFLMLALGMTTFAASGVISDGITVNGVSIGGMTKDEAYAVIQSLVNEAAQTPVTVMVGNTQIAATMGDFGLKAKNTGILKSALELGNTGNIVDRYKEKKDLQQDNKNYTLSYQLDQDAVRAFAQSCEAYNTEPVNATIYTTDELTPGVEGGTTGYKVNVDASIDAINGLLTDWNGSDGRSLKMVTDTTEPEVSYEDLAIISDVLGTATTDYSASSEARAINVQNGCRLVSGHLIKPGESFSVTNALVPFTAENGYEPAPSYEENQVVESYGGGICQVSTTLYNAVLKSELEVLQRSNHTMVVSYVDLSKDAAIAEGVMDFEFRNNQEYPIYIIGYCYGGEITFSVYGHETRPANRTIEFESKTLTTTEPTGAQILADTAQAVGYVNQTQSPHTGYTAELWKNIYVDGVLQDSVQINSSYYNAVGTIYDVGVATDNQNLYQAIYSAIGTGDINQVYTVVNNMNTYLNPTPQTETTAPTDGTQPQTDASQPQVDDSGDMDEVVTVY